MQAHPTWDVLNRGVNGERSDQIRARFDRDVVDARPRAVVIIAGVNDVYQGRTPEHVIDQLRWMYERATLAGIEVVAGTILPYNVATPDQNSRMRQINDWIRQKGKSTSGATFAVVDTRAAVAAPGNADVLFESPDGLHPTAAGYHRMADAIGPVLERSLALR
jgi:lysophospholipase L1-like esterase